MEEELLKTIKFAKIVGYQARTINNWCKQKKIIGYKDISGRWKIPKSEIEKVQNFYKKENN